MFLNTVLVPKNDDFFSIFLSSIPCFDSGLELFIESGTPESPGAGAENRQLADEKQSHWW
jgi:hypothetical protein